jgi:hypothetical protein
MFVNGANKRFHLQTLLNMVSFILEDTNDSLFLNL